MREKRAVHVAICAGVVLFCVAVLLASCAGTTRLGVCYEVPGLPGKVCVDLQHEGETKRVLLPRDVVAGSREVMGYKPNVKSGGAEP